MTEEAVRRACNVNAASLALGFLGIGLLLTTGAHAQNALPALEPAGEAAAPSVDSTTEAKLRDLAARFVARRSELDARRERIAREHDRLTAVDRPAGDAVLSLWRDRTAAVGLLERDMEDLRALVGSLTAEALKAVSAGKSVSAQALAPAPGLWRTAIDANLRHAPGGPPFAVLKAGTIVAQLATDSGGGWSLVAAPFGIGFVPASQLRREA